jgi:glycosyltransferase involved in cell wall biosynthesis
MKKIVISANTSWYIFNFRKNTIISLIESGFQVFVVAPRDDYTDKLINLGCKFYNVEINRSGKNIFNELKTIFYLNGVIRKIKPFVILNFTPKNNIYGAFVGWINKVHVVNNIAGLGFLFNKNSFSTKIALFLYKVTQKTVFHVFFQNSLDMDFFVQRKIVKHEKSSLLPGSGVDLDHFKISHAKDDGCVRFLFLGRLLVEKGIANFIEAAVKVKANYPYAKFQILGFFDEQNPSSISIDTLKKYINDGTIDYLGSSVNVANFIKNVDCVVLPSFYREGVPKSLLEAAAMAKPIITTNNVGCKETIVDGVNGFLCKVKDSNDLADKIERVINMSHNDRILMGLNGREKMEKEFDEKIVVSRYLKVVYKCTQ